MSDMTVIAQYSFPMNTESVTHGFRRHKIFSDAFASCPPIAGLCPESDVELNIQVVAIINASDERLIGSHYLRPNLDWRCKINAVRHDFGWPVCSRNEEPNHHLRYGRSGRLGIRAFLGRHVGCSNFLTIRLPQAQSQAAAR